MTTLKRMDKPVTGDLPNRPYMKTLDRILQMGGAASALS